MHLEKVLGVHNALSYHSLQGRDSADILCSEGPANARGEPPPEAGARYERTLEAVGSTAMLGGTSLWVSP